MTTTVNNNSENPEKAIDDELALIITSPVAIYFSVVMR